MSRHCTTHFHACDCREELFKLNEAKVAKLKSLLLLTDPVVSHVVVDETQILQHQEFLRCFPDERELITIKGEQ